MNCKKMQPANSQNDIEMKLKQAWIDENRLPKSTIEHYIVQWCIENFNYFPDDEDNSISSPSFRLGSSQTTWYITYHSPADSDEIKPSLYLYRFSKDKGPPCVAVTYRFGISDSDEEITWFGGQKNIKFTKGCVSGFHFSSVDEEQAILFEEMILQYDTFALNCEMYISYEIEQYDDCLTTADYDLINLSFDFAELMRSKPSSDYCVKIPHYDIATHKAILAARSPVFQKLLKENMSTSFITLEDESYSNITSLLLFMYTGNFNLVAKNGSPDIGFYECVQKFAVTELENLLAPKYLQVRTTIEMEELEVIWHIEDFSDQTKKAVARIKSPSFKTCHSTIQWTLTLHTERSSGEACSLAIFADATDKIDVLDSFMKISLIDEYGSLQEAKGTSQIWKTKAKFGLPEYIKNLAIYNHIFNFLQDDTLKIHCQLTFVTSKEMNDGHVLFRRSTSTKVSSYLNLSDDLRKFHKLGQWTDVRIQTNTSFINAHWAILFARSKVFASKFLNDGPEDEVKIPIDHDIVSRIVEHVYSGSLKQVPSDDLIKLLIVSEKYCFSKLLLVCTQLLGLDVNVNNFIDVFNLGRKLKNVRLIAKCFDFVDDNSKKIRKSKEWENWSEKHKQAFEMIAKWLLIHSGGKLGTNSPESPM